MKRLLIAVAIVAITALPGCGSNDDENASVATAANCKESNARELKQNFITSSKFDVECVKWKTGEAFFFMNNDDTTHTVTTDAGAPEMFDAELPKKSSTYSHTFTKPGTYHISCKRHSEKMTLIIV